MKLTFTGRQQDFSPQQNEKLNSRLKKLAKSIEYNGEREARVIVTQERHLNNVEITLSAFDHSLAGQGSGRDLFAAVNQALEKLEKQILKMRAKWRTTKRHKHAPHRTPEDADAQGAAALAVISKPAAPKKAAVVKKAAAARAAEKTHGRVEILRVNHHDSRKPMTVEEAMLEISNSDSYFSFRDADTDRISVLLRRKDGRFDLVET